MSIPELDNLVTIGKLKAEAGTQTEFNGLVKSGRVRLADANNPGLAFESRFDLAYNAAHAFALAALRWHGYRSESRYVVFQALAHTLGVDRSLLRILSKAHERRNLAEYEGLYEVDRRLLADLLDAAAQVAVRLTQLGPVPEP